MFFSKKTAALATIALLGGTASAQLSGLSSSCTASTAGLLLSLNGCLNLLSLSSIFTGSGSVVGPLDSYLSGICSNSACSSDTLSNANTTINQNCQEDIQSGSTLITALVTIIGQYPTVREAACLQAAGNGTRCITQTLYGIQNSTGQPLDVNFVTGLIGGGNSSVSQLANLPADVLCTECNRAIYQVANRTSNSSFASGAVARGINTKCGSNFTSTTTFPPTVSDPINPSAAASGSASGASGAAATTSRAAGAAVSSWGIDNVVVGAASAIGLGIVGGVFGVLA